MAAIAVVAASPPAPAGEAGRTIAAMKWHDRVLILFGEESDPRLVAQRRIAAADHDGFIERDIRTVVVAGALAAGAADKADDLRRRYRIAFGDFAAILIGKDGGEKLRSATPLTAAQLFATIDAMPMRRDEMRPRPRR